MAMRWYKASCKAGDARFMGLTPAVRGVYCLLEELVATRGAIVGNLTMIAGWIVTDRKTARGALEAIAASGLLAISIENRGKAGSFYSIADPKLTPSTPQADPKLTPSTPQADPNQAPDKSPIDAGLQDSSLYRVEENRVEETRAHAREASPFSSEELTALDAAIQGPNGKLAVGPNEVPLRLRRFLEEKISKGKLGEPVLDAFDALDRSEKIAWCVRSLEIAREKASGPGAWLSFAAGVIGRAIESGEDLAPKANVVEFKRPEAPPNPHADKPWGPLNDNRNFGLRWESEQEQIKYLAGRMAHERGEWPSQYAIIETYKTEGFEAAMAAMWALWPRKGKANG